MLTGEPLALDLVNTRTNTPDGEIDLLDDVEGFHSWLTAQAGRLTPPSASLSEADLAAFRDLRDHIGVAIESVRRGAKPPLQAISAINKAARFGPLYRAMRWTAAGLAVSTSRNGDEPTRLLAQLADAAIDLLSGPSIVRVRGCDGPHCRMLFLPANPRRRWCSPAVCGNRVRVARYYQRHKTE